MNTKIIYLCSPKLEHKRSLFNAQMAEMVDAHG